MKKFIRKGEHGTLIYDGKEIMLLKEPSRCVYVDGSGRGYRSYGVDIEGQYYHVQWKDAVVFNWNNFEIEEN